MTIKAQVLAETLFAELVQRKHFDWHPAAPGAGERLPNQLWIASTDIPAFDAKIQLYQFTCILLAVLEAAQTNTAFIAVQEHLDVLGSRMVVGHRNRGKQSSDTKFVCFGLDGLLRYGYSINRRVRAGRLTMRWSERRTAVRSAFEMTSTLPLRATRALVRRRSS